MSLASWEEPEAQVSLLGPRHLSKESAQRAGHSTSTLPTSADCYSFPIDTRRARLSLWASSGFRFMIRNNEISTTESPLTQQVHCYQAQEWMWTRSKDASPSRFITEMFLLEQNQKSVPNNRRRVITARYIRTVKYWVADNSEFVKVSLLT